jgi:hypothetical protein
LQGYSPPGCDIPRNIAPLLRGGRISWGWGGGAKVLWQRHGQINSSTFLKILSCPPQNMSLPLKCPPKFWGLAPPLAWNGSRLVKSGFEIGCTYTYSQYVEYLIFSYKLRHNMYLFTSAILGGKLKIVTVDAMKCW